MQAILLEDIRGLGNAGSVVTVARGYMRNYLEPRRLAEVATAARIAEVQRTTEQRVPSRRQRPLSSPTSWVAQSSRSRPRLALTDVCSAPSRRVTCLRPSSRHVACALTVATSRLTLPSARPAPMWCPWIWARVASPRSRRSSARSPITSRRKWAPTPEH